MPDKSKKPAKRSVRQFLGIPLPDRRSPTRVSDHLWHYIATYGATGTRVRNLKAPTYQFKPLDMAFRLGDRTTYLEDFFQGDGEDGETRFN